MKFLLAIACAATIAAPVKAQSSNYEDRPGSLDARLQNAMLQLEFIQQLDDLDTAGACETVKKQEKLGRPYDYFGDPDSFGPQKVAEICELDADYRESLAREEEEKQQILGMCQAEWGTDWTMVKHCVDEQTKAKRALGL